MNLDILVNKDNRLSKDFYLDSLIEIKSLIPGSIDKNRKIFINKEAYKAFLEMKKNAFKEGLDINIASAYRSYSYQIEVFKHYLDLIGEKDTLKRVALPGSSDHQTGLAIDYFSFRKNSDGSIFPYTDIKEEDTEYKWIKNNSYKYGFIIRFPKGKEDITKVMFEPWHIRYVGKDISGIIYYNNLTLEEYHQKVKIKTIQK